MTTFEQRHFWTLIGFMRNFKCVMRRPRHGRSKTNGKNNKIKHDSDFIREEHVTLETTTEPIKLVVIILHYK